MSGVILGFDTSNYTTSIAILDQNGALIANLKKMLPVKPGERGLRQSDAVFAHIKNLPELLASVREYIGGKNVLAIGASETPRRSEGSYMPCFMVGRDVALAASVAADCPLYCFSHQEGHIMAAVYSSGNLSLLEKPFAAFHISGGTTELVSVTPDGTRFSTDIVGGTKDLNAGQLIDRIGVYMGLDFPCGREMEKLALANRKALPRHKISTTGTEVNLSGIENVARRLYEQTDDKALVSAFVFQLIADAVAKMSCAYLDKYGDAHFVYAGGVMSNSIIRERLSGTFNCSFAEPDMSCDNAVGTAYLAYRSQLKQENL